MTRARRSGSIGVVQRDAPVTVKQMYAIAAALCKHLGERFPANRGEASDLIEKLRKASP
jgi:hypothetical protein